MNAFLQPKRFELTKLPGHIVPMISLSKKVLSEGRVAIVHGLQEMDSRWVRLRLTK